MLFWINYFENVDDLINLLKLLLIFFQEVYDLNFSIFKTESKFYLMSEYYLAIQAFNSLKQDINIYVNLPLNPTQNVLNKFILLQKVIVL